MTRLTSLAASALAVAALLAPTAQAHPGLPWFGQYQAVVVGGSGHIKWTYDHVPTSKCDTGGSGSGSDTVTFLSSPAETFDVTGIGPIAFPQAIPSLDVHFIEDRTGAISYDPLPAGCPGGNGNGGPPPAPDCGIKSGTVTLSVQLPQPETSVSVLTYPSQPTYLTCPLMGYPPPYFPSPMSASMPPMGPASDGGAPAGHAILNASGTDFVQPGQSGSADVHLELHLTRLLAVNAMGIPARDTDLRAVSGGELSLPLACPPGGACTGTVTLASSPGEAADATAAPPAFPTTIPAGLRSVASAHFRLRPHRHGVTVALPAWLRARLRSGAQRLDVLVKERAGRRTISYWAAVIQIRG